MAKYSGSGWHKQSIRHSNARKYGKAGGKYKIISKSDYVTGKKRYFLHNKDGEFIKGSLLKRDVLKEKKKLEQKKNYGTGDFDAGQVFQQLGGNKFIAMTGANNFIRDDNEKTIMFKVPHAKDRIKYVRIKLKPNDTYDMEFLSRKGILLRKTGFVYADKLQEIFTEYTGLDTHL